MANGLEGRWERKGSDLRVRETADHGKSNGDAGIEVSTRNMTNKVDYHHYC